MIVHAPVATRLDVAGAATACLTLFLLSQRLLLGLEPQVPDTVTRRESGLCMFPKGDVCGP
jgi:hypothetical protein